MVNIIFTVCKRLIYNGLGLLWKILFKVVKLYKMSLAARE